MVKFYKRDIILFIISGDLLCGGDSSESVMSLDGVVGMSDIVKIVIINVVFYLDDMV